MGGTEATASQAWAILRRHARDDISPLRLQELCRDDDRVSSLVSVFNISHDRMLLVDLSRQRMTLDTLDHLLRLATARGVKKFITRLAWGHNNPDNPVIPNSSLRQGDGHNYRTGENRKSARFEDPNAVQVRSRRNVISPERSIASIEMPSYHLALRAPSGKGYEMFSADGVNVLNAVHREWERIQRISDSIRRGQLPGVTGAMIRDVVVIGQGVPVMSLRFVYLALCKDHAANIARAVGLKGRRRIRFITSVDPVRAAATVADLDPASTMVINVALCGQEETALATQTIKSWLLQSLGSGRRQEVVLSKHMMLVTASEKLAASNKPESVFVIPEHSGWEPFASFSAANLLPLSLVFGWSITEQYLRGGHNMDEHFVETNPRHNLPVLLALSDIWNDSLLGSNGRVICPFTESFAAYPALCATIEAQVCGKSTSQTRCTSLVVDGGLHGAYDRLLYQSSKVQAVEMMMTMDAQIPSNASHFQSIESLHTAQNALISSFFAHADELAFGKESKPAATVSQSTRNGSFSSLETRAAPSEGNRPSTLLICSICDAFTCGQLVVLAEHRAAIKARIRDVDPFTAEVGSSLRSQRTEHLTARLQKKLAENYGGGDDDDDDDDSLHQIDDMVAMSLSTRTILSHFANVLKDQRATTST